MKISIVTPNYNYENFVAETIESVVSQDYSNFEHIIIDDGSKDNSVDVIQTYKDKYPNKIKFYKQSNVGQTATLNKGLKLAQGDIIGWLNSDDTYCKNIFSRIIYEFQKNPEVDILIGNVNYIDTKGNFIYERKHLPFSYITGCFIGFSNIITSNAIFWRRKAMKKNGLMDESLKCNMDGEFFSRLTYHMKVMHLPLPLANFRKQTVSIAAKNEDNWDKIISDEKKYELQNSYSRLKISKFIPYKYSKLFKLFYQMKRSLLRLIYLHYFEKKINLKKYRTTYLNKEKNI